MQVILLEKIGKLGKLGDEVRVKNGFARNYLIPQGKAQRATPENRAEFAARRAELEAQQAAILNTAQALAHKLAGVKISLTRKSSIDGRLFGSVTQVDIVENLAQQGIEVHKSMIKLPQNEHLKTTGEYIATLSLHHEVVLDITVEVIAEV